MSILSRRSSKFEKRIDTIEDELSTISSRIKSLAKDVDRQGDAVVQLASQRGGVPVSSKSASSVPLSSASSSRPAGDQAIRRFDLKQSHACNVREGYNRERNALNEAASAAARPVAREDAQFASYFMSGGLKKEVVEPLRRERHIQRRKALFLLLCFVVLLFALLFFRVWNQ
ncbi:MAG: hypothetical protein WCP86_05675 [bacterium]